MTISDLKPGDYVAVEDHGRHLSGTVVDWMNDNKAVIVRLAGSGFLRTFDTSGQGLNPGETLVIPS